jgi:hypothetical protein
MQAGETEVHSSYFRSTSVSIQRQARNTRLSLSLVSLLGRFDWSTPHVLRDVKPLADQSYPFSLHIPSARSNSDGHTYVAMTDGRSDHPNRVYVAQPAEPPKRPGRRSRRGLMRHDVMHKRVNARISRRSVAGRPTVHQLADALQVGVNQW